MIFQTHWSDFRPCRRVGTLPRAPIAAVGTREPGRRRRHEETDRHRAGRPAGGETIRLPACYKGLKARESSIPASNRRIVPEAARRIVDLYTAWGKPEKADPWHTEAARTTDPSAGRGGP